MVKAHKRARADGRKILNHWSGFRTPLRFSDGEGHTIFLWHYFRHPDEPLYFRYSNRVSYESGSTMVTTVTDVLQNGNRYWCPARPKNLVSI